MIAVQPVSAQEADSTPTEAAAAVTQQEADTAADKEPTGEVMEAVGTIFETPWWGWLVLLGGILFGLIAGKIAQGVLRGMANRLRNDGREVRSLVFHDIASPASLALLTFGIQIGLRFIEMPEEVREFAGKIIQFLYILALGWFFYNVVDIVDVALRRITERTDNRLAQQITPLIRKTIRVFVVIVFALFIAQNVFGVNITAWLAGLGIAGLAVSLAAQDSIKNLFGSITVLLDKPFAVGDRIQFSGADGFVEEIGFRSTKIRTFTGHIITVPNMKFIDGTVENVSARPFIRRMMDVTITYDTPPEKIDEAVQIIKDVLHEEELATPFNLDERPPRVYFNDFNADSLNISVAYWYFLDAEQGRDWWGYLEHGEKFNHRLFRAFGEAGIDFAFPSQTLYLAGDTDRQLAVHVLGDPAKQANN